MPRAGSVRLVLVSDLTLGPGSVPESVPWSEAPGPALLEPGSVPESVPWSEAPGPAWLELVPEPGSVKGLARMKQALVGWL